MQFPNESKAYRAARNNAQHVGQRTNLVVIAKSPLERILAYASERGWLNFRLLSSAGTNYNRDYHGETADGSQMPMLNVFVNNRGKLRHFFGTELLYAREADWYPKLSY